MESARRDLGKLAAHVLSGTDPEEAVVLAWPLVCGSAVAKRTRAESFHNGILSVLVPDIGWKSQLEEFSKQYLDGLSRLTKTDVLHIRYEVPGVNPRDHRVNHGPGSPK